MHTYTHRYGCTCMLMYRHRRMHAYTNLHMHTYRHACAYTYTYLRMYTHTHTHTCAAADAHAYTHAYTYTHTHTHTNLSMRASGCLCLCAGPCRVARLCSWLSCRLAVRCPVDCAFACLCPACGVLRAALCLGPVGLGGSSGYISQGVVIGASVRCPVGGDSCVLVALSVRLSLCLSLSLLSLASLASLSLPLFSRLNRWLKSQQ